MVGEPATTPPTADDHTRVGALSGAGPPRRPECCASPPNIANGGEPATGPVDPAVAATASPTRPVVAECGSTHAPRSQTRGERQSVSLPQGPCPESSQRCGPPHATAAFTSPTVKLRFTNPTMPRP